MLTATFSASSAVVATVYTRICSAACAVFTRTASISAIFATTIFASSAFVAAIYAWVCTTAYTVFTFTALVAAMLTATIFASSAVVAAVYTGAIVALYTVIAALAFFRVGAAFFCFSYFFVFYQFEDFTYIAVVNWGAGAYIGFTVICRKY
jgi:hypothetical protein